MTALLLALGYAIVAICTSAIAVRVDCTPRPGPLDLLWCVIAGVFWPFGIVVVILLGQSGWHAGRRR